MERDEDALKNMLTRTIKRSNKQFYEGDNLDYWMRLFHEPAKEKRFNSGFKWFRRSQQKLPTSTSPLSFLSTPSTFVSPSANEELHKLVKNSMLERLSNHFNREDTMLLKSNQGFKIPEKFPWYRKQEKQFFLQNLRIE